MRGAAASLGEERRNRRRHRVFAPAQCEWLQLHSVRLHQVLPIAAE
jgi:hypothetical protein